MDEGRIAGTSEIWDATEIRSEVDIEGVDWRCPGCHVRVLPAAWKATGTERVTAYFRRFPLREHDHGCLYRELTKAGPKKLGWGQMGTPRTWIDHIGFPPVTPPTVREPGDGPPHVPVIHSSTRRSLTGACRFHHAIGGTRKSWALTVTGVPGSNYFDVFQLFRMHPTSEAQTRIWFGDLFMAQTLVQTDTTVEVEVAGRSKVVARTHDWTAFQRTVFVDRLLRVLDRGFKPGLALPQVYVLAKRVPATSNVLSFEDPRKFALIVP